MKTILMFTLLLLPLLGSSQSVLSLRLNQFAGGGINSSYQDDYYESDVNIKLRVLSCDLVADFNTSETKFFRTRAGITRWSAQEEYTSSSTDFFNPGTSRTQAGIYRVRQTSMTFALGFGHYITGVAADGTEKNGSKFRTYIGGQLPFTALGKIVSESNDSITDPDNPFAESQVRTTKMDGGFSIGIKGFGGVRYMVSKKLGIGAEVSYGFQYARVGGEEEYYRDGRQLNGDNNGKTNVNLFGFAPVTTSASISLAL
ncbi:MAG: hypothetical protein WD077_02350 [Bacteroidia bacterium]